MPNWTNVSTMSSAPSPTPSPSPSSSSAPPQSLSERMAARRAKLRDLNRRRNEARRLNHAEVVEEDRRSKEPKNADQRKRRAEYILREEEERDR